jgi:hypothetical protein
MSHPAIGFAFTVPRVHRGNCRLGIVVSPTVVVTRHVSRTDVQPSASESQRRDVQELAVRQLLFGN